MKELNVTRIGRAFLLASGAVLGVAVPGLVGAGLSLLSLKSHGWQSNNLLAIRSWRRTRLDHIHERLGSYLGINKKLICWHQDFPANGIELPLEVAALARVG